jgi:hypothetical protein
LEIETALLTKPIRRRDDVLPSLDAGLLRLQQLPGLLARSAWLRQLILPGAGRALRLAGQRRLRRRLFLLR